MVLPGSPVPETVGVVSVTGFAAVGAVMTGVTGVSNTVKGTAVDVGLRLPAASRATAVAACAPGGSGFSSTMW